MAGNAVFSVKAPLALMTPLLDTMKGMPHDTINFIGVVIT